MIIGAIRLRKSEEKQPFDHRKLVPSPFAEAFPARNRPEMKPRRLDGKPSNLVGFHFDRAPISVFLSHGRFPKSFLGCPSVLIQLPSGMFKKDVPSETTQ